MAHEGAVGGEIQTVKGKTNSEAGWALSGMGVSKVTHNSEKQKTREMGND